MCNSFQMGILAYVVADIIAAPCKFSLVEERTHSVNRTLFLQRCGRQCRSVSSRYITATEQLPHRSAVVGMLYINKCFQRTQSILNSDTR